MPKHTSAYKKLTSKGALVRYAPRARLEEERKWHRTWRTEEDRLLQIQELAMDGFTLEQIDRIAKLLDVSEEHARHLWHVVFPTKENFRRRWLIAQFEQNEIDPYFYGHA